MVSHHNRSEDDVPTRVIVLGLDGSHNAKQAVAWCATYAPALDAEVVAIFSLEVPGYAGLAPIGMSYATIADEEFLAAIHVELDDWCAPLRDVGVPYRTEVLQGPPEASLNEVADRENADLIVVGRRGHGGFVEAVIGSVPHALAHSATRPLVIIPPPA
jgi:nucleotide-binding universal stress UspA family protein